MDRALKGKTDTETVFTPNVSGKESKVVRLMILRDTNPKQSLKICSQRHSLFWCDLSCRTKSETTSSNRNISYVSLTSEIKTLIIVISSFFIIGIVENAHIVLQRANLFQPQTALITETEMQVLKPQKLKHLSFKISLFSSSA